MDLHYGYVINTYSSTNMRQVQLFSQAGAQDPSTSCPWVYTDQGTNNPQVAGVGEASSLQMGSRVLLAQMGGKDGSYHCIGCSGRMGSGSDATSSNEVQVAQSDSPIPVQNPGLNGQRAQAKALDGQYNQYTGQGLNLQTGFPGPAPYYSG